MQRSFRRLVPALVISLLAAACGDLPSATPAGETAQLGFAMNLQGTGVQSVSVQVTAADISQPLLFNIPVASDGTATGRVDVPSGAARTLTVRAFNAQGAQTHEGSATVDVKPGTNPPVQVTLVPRAGELPISVSFGSVMMRVYQTSYPNLSNGYSIGAMTNFAAEIIRPDGTRIEDAVVRWASIDPNVMTVSPSGSGYAVGVGTTDIVGTWNGYGASVRVSVASGPDSDSPVLNAMSFDQEEVRWTGTPRTVWLNIWASDPTSGLTRVEAHIAGGNNGMFICRAAPTGTAGLWRCPVTVDATTAYGEYRVEYLDISDAAGYGVMYSPEMLRSMGMAARFYLFP